MRSWLLRHMPWWVPTAVWYAVMGVCTPVAVLILVSGLYGLDGVVDLAGWQILRALVVTGAGLNATGWCIHEWRHWREVSPAVLRRRPVAGRG